MEDYKTFLMDVIDDYNSKNENQIKFIQEGHTRAKDGTNQFILRLEVPGVGIFKSDYIGTNGLVYAMQEAYKRMLHNLLKYLFDEQFRVKIVRN